MKIAIDVKGTLEGPKGEIIAEVAHILRDRGHEITVWSSLLSYAYEYVKGQEVPYEIRSKQFGSDLEPEDWYDIAIEDDSSVAEILSANRVILVSDFNSVIELLGLIIGENHESNTDLKSAI